LNWASGSLAGDTIFLLRETLVCFFLLLDGVFATTTSSFFSSLIVSDGAYSTNKSNARILRNEKKAGQLQVYTARGIQGPGTGQLKQQNKNKGIEIVCDLQLI